MMARYTHFKKQGWYDDYKRLVSTSIMALKYSDLDKMLKIDLIEIILLREQLLFKLQNQLSDKLKGNDRILFKILRKENLSLRKIIEQKSSEKEKELLEYIKTLKREISFLRDQRNRVNVY